jgi:hypothetical protein
MERPLCHQTSDDKKQGRKTPETSGIPSFAPQTGEDNAFLRSAQGTPCTGYSILKKHLPVGETLLKNKKPPLGEIPAGLIGIGKFRDEWVF